MNTSDIADAHTDLSALNADILANTLEWDFYYINTGDMILSSSENDLPETFTVCAGDIAEFWLKLTGVTSTQSVVFVESVALFETDTTGAIPGGATPIVISSVNKVASQSSSDTLTLFWKGSIDMTGEKTFKIRIGATINANMVTIPAGTLQWGYREYPMDYPFDPSPTTSC